MPPAQEPAAMSDEPDLPEQSLLRVGAAAFAAFQARLAAPPQPNERLRKTMQSVPEWERSV
ncbi:DUF1778 domain-containing protein [uncultured Thiodictyon sp.]|uniref:type II toxin -antitoxin system TacA 1-like antitoxin n=1 Tax=uncultured Thiodictyon sp. TaxID=1846217 RepID=UPI0025D9ABAD|nr:DUF1778 domain-containing protein [uncultured Thiodictyon sp.]